MKIVNPSGLIAPRGFNHGILCAAGNILFVAGQIGWTKDGIMGEGLVAQFEQALSNILEVVTAEGGKASDIGRFTIYIKDKHDYQMRKKEIGVVYRQRMGNHYPAMSLVVVNDLLEEGAEVEIEATAVIP
jgi:enamine deaminase RidA (YjgF/YER057c/UK114 family)